MAASSTTTFFSTIVEQGSGYSTSTTSLLPVGKPGVARLCRGIEQLMRGESFKLLLMRSLRNRFKHRIQSRRIKKETATGQPPSRNDKIETLTLNQ